jgi:hypothetical protein
LEKEELLKLISEAVRKEIANVTINPPAVKLVHHGLTDLQKCPQCKGELENYVNGKISDEIMNRAVVRANELSDSARENSALFAEHNTFAFDQSKKESFDETLDRLNRKRTRTGGLFD